MEREDYDAAAIKKSSIACEALCLWCRAMYKYHFVSKAVEPKRQALAKAEAELAETTAKLNAAKQKLAAVNAKLEKLETQFNESVAKQNKLSSDIEICALRLDNANKLIGGLGGEKERWSINVKVLGDLIDLLPGALNSLAAATKFKV